MTEGNRNQENGEGNLSDLFEDNHKIPLPIIPIRVERSIPNMGTGMGLGIGLGLGNPGQKILPDFNFQSLFRKKSHLRLAKNKKKEEMAKIGNRGTS